MGKCVLEFVFLDRHFYDAANHDCQFLPQARIFEGKVSVSITGKGLENAV